MLFINLVSDSLPSSNYDKEIIFCNKKIKNGKDEKGTLAGSNLTLDKIVENLEEGTRVVPKIFEMTNDRDRFLDFCKNCPHIKKEGNRYYRIEEAKKFEVVK